MRWSRRAWQGQLKFALGADEVKRRLNFIEVDNPQRSFLVL